MLDQATLELELNDRDAALLNQDLVAIQTEAALLQSQINRELSELDIATEFLAVVRQRTVEETEDDLEAAADAFEPGSGGTGGGGAGSDSPGTESPGTESPGGSSGPGRGAAPGEPGREARGATLVPFSGGLLGGSLTPIRFGRVN